MTPLTDAQLEALVGRSVAKIQPRKILTAMNADSTSMAVLDDEMTTQLTDVKAFCFRHTEYHVEEIDEWPRYLTDKRAVLGLLEAWVAEHQVMREVNIRPTEVGWAVDLREGSDAKGACADTFCRAAVFALLRAHGIDPAKP